MEFFQLEPFGLPANDALQANLASLLANIYRDTQTKPEPFLLKDFLVFPEREKESAEEATVDGFTCAQHKLLLDFQALKIHLSN